MPRFLTPSKIGILALIELYTDAVVPAASTIPILSFILNQILPSNLPRDQATATSSQQLPYVLDIRDFEGTLSTHGSASGHPGRNLWDHFLTKLWRIDSLDALHEFFARSRHLLIKPNDDVKKDGELGIPPPSGEMILLSRTSPLGTFVRRAIVEFERLKFSDTVQLWTAFVRWRQETKAHWAKRSGETGRWAGRRVLCQGEEEWGVAETEILELAAYGIPQSGIEQEGRVSTDDVEKLLEFQIEQMQSEFSNAPDILRDKFRVALGESIVKPSLSHYLNFLDAWRSGDYPASFDNLHRYFDYTMENRDRLFYQYALMNLAVLQADFGCFSEAVAAMLETVSTARENQDMSCLNFALNWLYHFGKAHPKFIDQAESTNMLGLEKEGLLFLSAKAKETEMWTLWSSSLLSQAKLGMANGESIAKAFENILKSSQLIVEKNMKSMMGPQMAMLSSLWARLGVVRLSRQYCEIFLQSHAQYGLFDDILRFTCRLAYFLTEKGRYDEAMELLDNLDENSLRSWKANQYWLRYRGMLRLKRDLHKNNLDGADQLLAQLLQGLGSEGDSDTSFEIRTLHIDYLIRRTDFGAAFAKIAELAKILKEEKDDINLQIRLLIIKALFQSKVGRAQRGFSVALRAAGMAWRARLLPSLWAAMGAIANILISLSEFHAASEILISVIPQALECEICVLSAQLYSFLVDAYMGMAGQAEATSPKRTEKLTSCLEYIDRAFAEYSSLEDVQGQCEMMAKKATVMMVMGDNVLANDYASAYLDLRKEAAMVMD